MDPAFEYVRTNPGIDTESSYPYEATNGPCRFRPETVGAECTGKKKQQHSYTLKVLLHKETKKSLRTTHRGSTDQYPTIFPPQFL
jgi:hypothetical protein